MIASMTLSTLRSGQPANLESLAAIPKEEIWLASQKSARTRRAYRQDVAHFMRTLGSCSVVCMDGLDLHDARRAGITLNHVLEQKVRRSVETGEVLARVRDLFSTTIKYV